MLSGVSEDPGLKHLCILVSNMLVILLLWCALRTLRDFSDADEALSWRKFHSQSILPEQYIIIL